MELGEQLTVISEQLTVNNRNIKFHNILGGIMSIFVKCFLLGFIVIQMSVCQFFEPLLKATIPADMDKWEWRPIVAIPAFKVTESTRPNTDADVLLLASTGGGISYQHLIYDATEQKYNCTFSVSPLTLLLTGNLTANNPIDLSYMASVGIWNNLFMFGVGYDLGSITGRSRVFGAFSVGINLNN